MTVKAGSRTRSAGGAFRRSPGGAFTRMAAQYYYVNEFMYENVNLSDFSGWSHSVFSDGMFDEGDNAPQYALYDSSTGSYIGMITKYAVCTPKIHIFDGVPTTGPYLTAPTSCPMPADNFIVEDNNVISNQYIEGTSRIFGTKIYFYGIYGRELVCFSPTVTMTDSNGSAYGSHTALTTELFMHPNGTTPLIKVGINFYNFGVKTVIDETINTWYNGKFDDGGVGTLYYATRTSLNLIDSTYYTPTTGSYIYDCAYYSCLRQNTRVTLPT